MKQKSLKTNVALNFIRTIVRLFFPLITFPYISRILLPNGIGKVNFAQSIVSYFSLIAALGITNYAIREASKIREDKNGLTKFAKEILIINFISTIIAYFLLIISIFLFPLLTEYKKLLYVCSGTILFSTLGMEWLYTAVEDFTYITIRSVIFQIISLILIFCFVKTEDDYLKYAAISVFSNVGSNLMNFIHSHKILNYRFHSNYELKKHLKPIFLLFAMSVTIQVYTVLDTTMLGIISGEWEVGIYTSATKINKIVLSLVVAISSVLLPRLSYYSSKKDQSDFNNLISKGLDLLLLISIPSTIGLSILSKDLILIFSGKTFINAIPSMRIMNPIIIIIGLSNFIGIQIFMPLNKEKCTLYSVIAGAITNFTLNCILIPKYASLGASIATLCAESIVTLVQLFFARKIINFKFLLSKLLLYGINSLIMSLFVLCLIKIIDIKWLSLVSGIIVGVFIYFICLLLEKNHFLYSFGNFLKSRSNTVKEV